MVSRSTIAASLVVVLALLAGCSGLVGDGGPQSPEDVDLAAGYAADGVTDGDRAAESYRQALGETHNYTVDYRQNLSGAGQTTTLDGEYRVDVDGERAYHRFGASARNVVREDYFADGRQYTRQSRNGRSDVASGDREFVQANYTGATILDPLLSNETDYETSLDERDGTTVVVYETRGAENAAAVFEVDASNVSAYNRSFAVDAAGLVHEASYDLTYVDGNGDEQRVTMTFDLRAVDDTAVERPEWATEN
jgi:hypothetical protein